jgi:hypothetical protein
MTATRDRATDTPATSDLHEQLMTSRRAAARRLSPERQRRLAFALGAAFGALILLLLVGESLYARNQQGRIFYGVKVAGVSVGGLDREAALARLRAPERADMGIAEALLDQRAFAGVGNEYKSEILFLHRLDPWTLVQEVDDETLRALLARHGITYTVNTNLPAPGTGGAPGAAPSAPLIQ